MLRKRTEIMSSPPLFVALYVILFVVGASSSSSSCRYCHAFIAPTSSWWQQYQHHQHRALLVPVVSTRSSPSSSSTSLYGINKRRGQLGNNVSFDDDGTVRLISNKQKQRRGSSSSNSNNSNKKSTKRTKGGVGDEEVVISPLLAQWAATDDVDSSTSTSVNTFDSISDEDDAEVNYQVLDGKISSSSSSATTTQQMDALLDEINVMLSTTNCNVPSLVAKIVSLVNLGSPSKSNRSNNDRVLLPTLKALLSAKTTMTTRGNNNKQPPPQASQQRLASYRLAWAGSDDAICHIGTSLHKVPLARLQEIYLTLGGGGGGSTSGKSKWELLEVIRILGPFPNVRNTLRGDVTKLTKMGDVTGMKRNDKSNSSSGGGGGGREGVRMEIAYNSMIDGTGKEILASGESRVKYVQLDVWFANEKALVCTTTTTVPSLPASSSSNDENGDGDCDPLSINTNGSQILFFVAEENLEEQLEKLRAA